MQSIFIQYICLILIILGLVMIANKLRLAYPIVLVLGGLALSFIAPFSNITINPELVGVSIHVQHKSLFRSQ